MSRAEEPVTEVDETQLDADGARAGSAKRPQLGSVIDRLRRKREREAPRIPRVPRDPAGLPVSSTQKRLWFIEQLQPGTGAYNIGLTACLEGTLDRRALASAFRRVAARHESLRTRFVSRDGEPLQVIEDAPRVAMPLIDLSGVVPDCPLRGGVPPLVQRLVRAVRSLPFDLRLAPLLRTALLRLGPTRHVLVVSQHHIVGDGWSTGILIRDVLHLYRTAVEGVPATLPPLTVQYADYADWQRRTLGGDTLAPHLDFWRRHLVGSPPVFELPWDRPRPPVESHRGELLVWGLSPATTAGLRDLGQQHGTTLFVVLMATFQAVLHRWSGRQDFVIGIPVAHRELGELQHLIGFFANTLALRAQLDGEDRFDVHLRRLHAFMLEAHRHQAMPFEQLVESLQPERTLSHAPLFQVVFTYQNVPMPRLELPGLTLEPLPIGSGTALFDLTLHLEEGRDRLAGWFEYNSDLFDRTSIRRLEGHLRRVLDGVLREPAGRLADLSWLGPVEAHQILREWNDTAWEAGPPATLSELVAGASERSPAASAVVLDDAFLSYRELIERSRCLAASLRNLGVGPEVRVGVALERSFHLVVALLGVLEAGGAYVPLDPEYPPERLAFMIADAGITTVLTRRQHAGRLADAGARVVEMDSGPRPTVGSGGAPSASAGPGRDDLGTAYVIYTSGSTGRPKGTEVPHRGVVNRLRWVQGLYPLGPGARVLQKTPFTFDVSVWELFWPLATGATLVLARPGDHRDPAAIARTVGRHAVDVIHFVPSMLAAFLEHPAAEEAELSSLRRVFVSGEALTGQLADRFFDRFALPLENLYGPTEASIEVTHWRGRPRATRDTPPRVTIGRPIGAVRAHVVDRGGGPVGIGAPGELLIGGVAVTRGYAGWPSLTAERFVPDPFASTSATPGARLYRTGDLVRLVADGEIDFLGRIDQQVKVRGFRIELGEIEAGLLEHPGVQEAAVAAHERDQRGIQLAGYVVAADPDRPPDIEALRDRLAASLPDYMLPATLTLLDALPRGSSGKIDRRALPAPQQGASEERFVLPRGPVEEMMAGLWAEVVGVDRVSVHDSFFALGGHSLLAPRLLDRLEAAFGVEIPLATLFERPTVAALAAAVEEGLFGDLPPADRRPIEPAPRSAEGVPLSFAQERLWFFDQVQPGDPTFNMPLGVRLQGDADIALLERCLNEVLRRHEALRTRFVTRGGEPRAVVAPPQRVPLPVVELAGLGERAADEARRLAAREARRPFDLAAGPLVHWRLLRVGPRDHHLLLTLHHIAGDGWSLSVLVRELGILARSGAQDLPELPVQYADYAAWERRAAQEGRFEASAAYWLAQLGGAPTVLEVPTDRPRPPVQTFRGAVSNRVLEPALVDRLQAVSREVGGTLYMTLLAVFQMLIYGGTDRRDLVVGSPVANRRRPETEGLIGFFVNMVALRARFSDPGLTVEQHVARTRASVIGASVHQGFPFDRLVQRLQPERDPARPPIFQVVFAYQEDAGWDLRLPGLEAELLPDAHVAARYDLHLSVVHHEGRLHATLTYNLDLYDPATAALLLERFEALARVAAADPGASVDRLVESEVTQPMRRQWTMQRKALSQSHRDKLLGFKKQQRPSARRRLVEEAPAIPGESLPLLVTPAVRDVDLVAWIESNRSLLDERLRRHGAVLLRGFDVPTIDEFRRVAETVSPDLLDYGDPSTPRTEIGKKVYTSTEYPADQVIPLHNELSYNRAWPMKIFFYCVTPAETEGETPLADSREILRRIDPEVRQRFIERGVMYVRNFGEGYGLPWQKVFQTESRAEVEAYCREHGFELEWKESDRLRTRHVRPAVARHPETGDTIWFNQANVHHHSSLPAPLRESLLAVAEDPRFPLDMNACYGDGTLIDEADVAEVRHAIDEVTVKFPWQQGDVLLADNMLVAHGRSAFTGPRKVMVLMAESHS